MVEDEEEAMDVGDANDIVSVTSPLPTHRQPKYDLMTDEQKSRRTFFKETKTYPMFPCKEEKLKWDDYGEPIR